MAFHPRGIVTLTDCVVSLWIGIMRASIAHIVCGWFGRPMSHESENETNVFRISTNAACGADPDTRTILAGTSSPRSADIR